MASSNAHDPIDDGPMPVMPPCRNCKHAWSKHRASDNLCPFLEDEEDRFYEPAKLDTPAFVLTPNTRLVVHSEPPPLPPGYAIAEPMVNQI